jgi:hypothetical protein
MTFSIEHDFDDLFRRMNEAKIFNENTFVSILKKASKPLQLELERTTPDSLKNFAQGDNPNYSKSAEASRAKYGQLGKSIGVYKSKGTQSIIGNAAVNIGYLRSKQDKAFVAHFLNYGWRNAKSGRVIEPVYKGWMQKAEKTTYPSMKAIFDKETEKVFEENIQKKWAKAQKRKVK